MKMETLSTLRIYIPSGTRVKASGFMKKLTAPPLSHYLLRQARAEGVPQAIIHNVSAGYLAGMKISYSHYEIKAGAHPECLELIGHVAELKKFIADYEEHLEGLHCIISMSEEHTIISEEVLP
ncbi:TPA: hypothetical protein MAT86_002205 [Klebsiella aerogenes]|nr:hypothetical protein [Klebsiella aerogenes]